ncbi:hypothetical protein AVEN_177238-1 [Araneus ventricosus]|uniref:Uncharacterized protein n=1 Tax=Araneus ventricosus TaxID=182803 RepID=A0A4Y2VQN5_ARAVE|nr:hypothetical protein AVEN_177238-1 [Araneus ventricosus]
MTLKNFFRFSLVNSKLDSVKSRGMSSARLSPRVRSPTENHEPTQDFQKGSSSPTPYMRADDYRRTIHAGYNGMTFTPWVTLPGEKTPDLHRPFHPGPPLPPR